MDILNTLTSVDMSSWSFQLIQLTTKGILVLGITWGIAYLLRHSAAAVRYMVWCTGLLSLMTLPLFSSLLPTWELAVLPEKQAAQDRMLAPATGEAAVFNLNDYGENTDAASLDTASRGEANRTVNPGLLRAATPYYGVLSGISWTTWVFLIWGVGALVILGRLIVAHIGATMLVKRAEMIQDDDWYLLAESIQKKLNINQIVRLRFSTWTTVPISLGIIKPFVILPDVARDWNEDQRRTVLVHELSHIKRRDCLLHLVTQITCALHWFNPMTWVAAWQLRVERERACDDMVLNFGINASNYAETLLETARSLRKSEWSTVAAVSMARHSQLEGRLLSILDPIRHRKLNRASAVLVLGLITCIALPLSLLTPVRAERLVSGADAPDISQDVTDRKRSAPHPKAPGLAGNAVVSPVPEVPQIQVYVPDIDLDIPPIQIPEINIPSMDIVISPIDIPAIDIDIPGTVIADVDTDYYGIDDNLAELPIDSLTIDQIISLRKYGVDGDFIRQLREMGFSSISYKELIALGKYGADADFIQEMRQSGYANYPLSDYAKMSKYGVDGSFIRAMSDAGFNDLKADDLITMSKYGVDEDLIASLGKYGYSDLGVDALVAASKYGVDEDLIESLATYGYTDLEVDELVAASKYGVDEDLVVGLERAGYRNIALNDLISMSKYGVDEDLVVSLARNGYADLSADELIRASKYGVDEDLIEQLSRSGFSSLAMDDLVAMSKYGVDEDLVAALGRNGYQNLTPDEIIAASKYGVDEDLIDVLNAYGYAGISIDEVIAMSKYGVDEDLIEEMTEAGFDFTPNELIKLSKYGVDADYIRELSEAGLEEISLDKLIELKKHGVDADFIKDLKGN